MAFSVGIGQRGRKEWLTEAYRTREKNLLLQALLMDPVVNSIEAAKKLLDEMLVLQKDFLPEFK